MAVKCRITFYAYHQGKEIDHVSATTMVNTFDEAEQRMKAFIEERYEAAKDITVLRNEKSEAVGAWQIFGRSNTNTDAYFLFVINKL